jgi:MOSC domain-containing protein YiiM
MAGIPAQPGGMKLISVNVGLPRQVPWLGSTVATAIFKAPVEHAVQLRHLNLDGDRQADLTVHGGVDKAVYLYPSEHYEFWRQELPETELPWGSFGENFTSEGMFEHSVCIGDHFRVGSAVVAVTQPRMPCFKLGIKFGRNDIIKRFLASRRTGFYFSVVDEGEVSAGDVFELLAQDENKVSVAEIVRLYVEDHPDPELLRRSLELKFLPANWREYFLQRIQPAV